MKVNISDKDLDELIRTGKNSKYKKYSKDRKFMEGLARVYKVMLNVADTNGCLLYTSPSPRDRQKSRMPSSA